MSHANSIERLAPFVMVAPTTLEQIAATARSLEYAPRTWLFRTGEPCDGVIFVTDGFVRLYRLAPDSTEVTTGIVGPGDFVTGAVLRGRTEHDDNARALSRVRTVELPATVLLEIASRSPRVFEALVRCLLVRRNDVYADASAIAHEDLSARILRVLQRLARPPGMDAIRPLAVRLPHSELARLAGADRATVTRLVGSLTRQGLVRQERGHITGVAVVATTDGGPHGGSPGTGR